MRLNLTFRLHLWCAVCYSMAGARLYWIFPINSVFISRCAADIIDKRADAVRTCPAVGYCIAGIQLYFDSPINLVETTMQYNILTGVGFGGGSVCFFVGAALLLARQVRLSNSKGLQCLFPLTVPPTLLVDPSASLWALPCCSLDKCVPPILWAALFFPACRPTGFRLLLVDAALLLARQVRLRQLQELRWFLPTSSHRLFGGSVCCSVHAALLLAGQLALH